MEDCLRTNCGGVDLEYEFEAEMMEEGPCVAGCAQNGVTDPDMKFECAQCCEEAGCLETKVRVSRCVIQNSCIPGEDEDEDEGDNFYVRAS